MVKQEPTVKTVRVRGKTSTQEILGAPAPSQRIGRKWAEPYRKLIALRDELSGTRLNQTDNAREQVPTFSEHMADAASDSYDRDCALALLSSTQNALYEIEQALDRIQKGTYGMCELTGDPIEEDRLKAIPWTRYSAAAQGRLEAHGGRPRVHLGLLGSCLHSADADSTATDEVFEAEAEREAA